MEAKEGLLEERKEADKTLARTQVGSWADASSITDRCLPYDRTFISQGKNKNKRSVDQSKGLGFRMIDERRKRKET